MFSALPDFAKKTYVIKDIVHQERSFINTGPIHTIEKCSRFPTSHVIRGMKRSSVSYKSLPPIVKELKDVFCLPTEGRRQRDPFEFQEYTNYSARMRFFITLEIVNLFTVLRAADLKIIFESIFQDKKIKPDLYCLYLSLLKSAEYIQSDLSLDDTERYFVSIRPDKISFLESEYQKPLFEDSKYWDLQTKIRKYYEKNHPKIIDYLDKEAMGCK